MQNVQQWIPRNTFENQYGTKFQYSHILIKSCMHAVSTVHIHLYRVLTAKLWSVAYWGWYPVVWPQDARLKEIKKLNSRAPSDSSTYSTDCWSHSDIQTEQIKNSYYTLHVMHLQQEDALKKYT